MHKNWDAHVLHAEEIARSPGFMALRDRIVDLAAPYPDDVVIDVGSGTGLLTLALAGRVRRVWAVDIAPAMGEYLRSKAASAGQAEDVEIVTASAASLPLVDGLADLVVSNYCFHHLDDEGKRKALNEAFRVLKPGGRLVFGDMMFTVAVTDARDRQVVAAKVRAMLRKGLPGVVRLARNAVRFTAGRWERPARAEWWGEALRSAGFIDVSVEVLDHEGGVAVARRPAPEAQPQKTAGAAVPALTS